jgi:hypothetical protein
MTPEELLQHVEEEIYKEFGGQQFTPIMGERMRWLANRILCPHGVEAQQVADQYGLISIMVKPL